MDSRRRSAMAGLERFPLKGASEWFGTAGRLALGLMLFLAAVFCTGEPPSGERGRYLDVVLWYLLGALLWITDGALSLLPRWGFGIAHFAAHALPCGRRRPASPTGR